jgi:GT2 family glycosyltransferase
MGSMAATSAMLRKHVWEDLGKFDERYETGGEDTAMARKMLKAGFKLVREPLLYVHHSHGLGPIDSLKQLWDYTLMAHGPRQLNKQKITKRRSHINFE